MSSNFTFLFFQFILVYVAKLQTWNCLSQEEGLLDCVLSKLDTFPVRKFAVQQPKANQNIFGVQYMCIYGFVVGDFTVGRATQHRTPQKKFVAT